MIRMCPLVQPSIRILVFPLQSLSSDLCENHSVSVHVGSIKALVYIEYFHPPPSTVLMIAKSEWSALLTGKPTVGHDPESDYPSVLSFTCNLMLSPAVSLLIFQLEMKAKKWLLVEKFHSMKFINM